MIKIIFIVSILVLGTSFSGIKDEKFSLKVEVGELRNSTGIVQFALYNQEGTIPDEHYKKHYKLLRGEIRDGSAQVMFTDLPPGKYAVNVLHDENSNGKIDKGLILPKEGIGFSNIQSIGIGKKPSFAKASFQLEGNATIRVKVIYM
ncbi:MAG TPA: DUF2141 domain-containing protein [Chryseosolibacter sp.]|nr:DUF2141 domain-containing protein [Chryseosolibacter sp.]